MQPKNELDRLPVLKSFLFGLLSQEGEDNAIDWLEQQSKRIAEDASGKKIFMAFSQASRYFTKDMLVLNRADLQRINEIVPGFRPDSWNRLLAARTYLLLHFPAEDADHFLNTLDKIFEMADLHELEALYASLPLLPYPEKFRLRAAEGLRTNITSVFDAIALNNPYPARYLNEDAWNQMLIKAVFLQRPLYKIIDADSRANENLARILIDFAHERWKAGRSVIPELWRFVGPFMTDADLVDIQKEINSGTSLSKEAVLLACSMSGLPAAQKLLQAYPEVKAKIENKSLNWHKIGKQFEAGL